MASKLGLFNQALQRLGDRRIETDTEETAENEALSAVYDECREEVLATHPWSFARTRVELARIVDTPLTVWTYYYQLPADLIEILQVSDGTDSREYQDDSSIPYVREEDDKIAVDAEDVYLTYTRDVTDVNLMPVTFRTALSWKLAADVAYRLMESTTKQQWAEGKYLSQLEFAKSKDAPKGRIRRVRETSWVMSRRVGLG